MTLLPMENKERILCALKCFNQRKSEKIPPILENYIKEISRNGQTMFPWVYVKPLLLHKFNQVVETFHSVGMILLDHIPFNPTHVDDLRGRVYNSFALLEGIPFTIQRICELLEVPTKHYLRVDKYLRGFEKVCLVVSTVDPEGNKIHQGDVRFPSRAGLDECSLPMNGSLSPPNSPSANNLQYHHLNKSSDEENIEDDVEDNSSDGNDEGHPSSTSASDLSTNSSMNSTPTASSWLFKSHNAANLPCTPPMGLRNNLSKPRISDHSIMTTLCSGLLTNPLDDDEYEVINNSEITCSTKAFVKAPESDLLISTTTNSEFVGDSQSSTSSCPVSEIDVTSFSSWKEIKLTKKSFEHSFSDGENEADSSIDEYISSDAGTSLSTDSSNIKSIHDLSMDVPVSLCSVPHVLRPIGQLEAFVQNLTSEVSSQTTTTTFSLPNTNKIMSNEVNSPDSTDSPIEILSDCQAKIELVERIDASFSSTNPPVFSTKRRPQSPELGSTTSELEETINEIIDSSKMTASPAKKCRIDTEESTLSFNSFVESTSTEPRSALNDSPPLILSNPLNVIKNEESGCNLLEDEHVSFIEDSCGSDSDLSLSDAADDPGMQVDTVSDLST